MLQKLYQILLKFFFVDYSIFLYFFIFKSIIFYNQILISFVRNKFNLFLDLYGIIRLDFIYPIFLNFFILSIYIFQKVHPDLTFL